MRIFKEPNLSNDWKCPVCKTDENKKVVLVEISGTKKDKIAEAEQFHLSCIGLTFNKVLNLLYQRL